MPPSSETQIGVGILDGFNPDGEERRRYQVMGRAVPEQEEFDVRRRRRPPEQLSGEDVPPQPVVETGKPWHRSVSRLGLRVVRRGEPQAVAHDGPADPGADIVVREPAAPLVAEPDPGRARERVAREKGEHASLERIATRVGHGVDGSSNRPAIAGVVAALLHFHGPHEVVGEDEVRGGWVEVHVRDVDAVDEVGVLEPRGPTDVHRVAWEVARVGVGQKCDDGTVITTDRQGIIRCGIHVGPDRGAGGVDREPLRIDHDFAQLEGLRLESDEAEIGCVSDADEQAVDDHGPEPDALEPHRVAPRRKGKDLEEAL